MVKLRIKGNIQSSVGGRCYNYNWNILFLKVKFRIYIDVIHNGNAHHLIINYLH